MKNMLKISDVSCDENQFRESDEVSEDDLDLKALTEHAVEGSYLACKLNASGFGFEFIKDEKEDPKYDDHLDCFKSELKKLKPELEIVKDFNKDVECDQNELKRILFHRSEVDSTKRVPQRDLYYKMKHPKCTFEEFLQEQNVYVLFLEKTLLIKTSNLSFAEIDEILKEKTKLIFSKKMDCLLGSLK
jgi:hypothetical protein